MSGQAVVTASRGDFESQGFEYLLKQLAVLFLIVRYEDLVSSPRETVDRLAAWTGLDLSGFTALVAKGALNGVHFRTDDLDATFEKVRASGADIVQEPTDQPWGPRDCAVRDPSGNLVRIDQK